MADIRPFAGVRYARNKGLDFSNLVAPPYDVLDEQGRFTLLSRDPRNIVRIDLPHLPPKAAGPDSVYQAASNTLQAWLKEGVLQRDTKAALYPYTQSYEHDGRTYHRKGFIALVKLEPLGAGHIIPHEKTYKGPIEDRLKLMRATGVQLSPIFGLYPDRNNEITSLLYKDLTRPEISATLDGVKNDLWSVTDAEVENKVIELMGLRKIYIADGHHRYTTALQYQFEAEQANGGQPLPKHHPANWCMFVLVGMQDPGLLILPTHRLIGGLESFDVRRFASLLGRNFEVQEATLPSDQIVGFVQGLQAMPPHTFGLYDGTSRKLYTMRLKNLDVLEKLEPERSIDWRQLDVAILQRYLIEEVLQPHFAGGKEVTKGYTPEALPIVDQVDGQKYQAAILLQPTPLVALEELGRHNEVMPQKSTYFYPKLATGMVLNPLK